MSGGAEWYYREKAEEKDWGSHGRDDGSAEVLRLQQLLSEALADLHEKTKELEELKRELAVRDFDLDAAREAVY